MKCQLISETSKMSLFIAVCATLSFVRSTRGEDPPARPIRIVNPRVLVGNDIPAVRVPLGIPNDYKPFLARLQSGGLLVVAFCFGPIEGIDGYAERAVFRRSKDGGMTWGPREERLDIQGREFGLTVLHDGTLLMTCHWLARDVFNPSKHTHSKIFRSTDEGKTWSEIRIGPDGFPDRAETAADWMAFEIPNEESPGKLITCVGVSMQHGGRTWGFDHDRIVISDVNHGSGGGFGNTIQLPDESLVSVYSYRGADNKTNVDTIRWRLPKARSKQQ